ncbi:hypothetical protein EXA23_15450 [Vibrio cincinnatiensis]|uniref:oligosaccharide flippase family protein n=1 Tax=Vibrio cincinnatiensis TaxID=675 RepID=UPI001EDFFC74|nr:oligosaccharide flippase family protein [Vibrio cincinnatiensis]MCG3767563.1 hypothetical protein [Vibrio cincinnatiensis]
MKQSFIIVLIQIFNALFGFFITIYVASNAGPNNYAVFVIYQVVISFMAAFSFMGYETHMIRNLLQWERTKRINRLKFYISKTIVSRFLLCTFLVVPVAVYIFYLSQSEYSEYGGILYVFILSGYFTACTQSISLILKAQNRYVTSVLINVVGMMILKLISLIAFMYYGFYAYIGILVFGSCILALVSIFSIKKYFSLKCFRFRYALKIKKNKDYILSGYMQYLVGYSDRVLLSVILTPDIVASYNLAKQVQEMAKLLIEGFFDPLCQKVVVFKNDKINLANYLKKLIMIKRGAQIISIIILSIFFINIDMITSVLKLDAYQDIGFFILLAGVSSLLYLSGKVETNYNALTLPPLRLLKYNIHNFILSIGCIVLFSGVVESDYIYLNRVFLELFLMMYNVKMYNGISK